MLLMRVYIPRWCFIIREEVFRELLQWDKMTSSVPRGKEADDSSAHGVRKFVAIDSRSYSLFRKVWRKHAKSTIKLFRDKGVCVRGCAHTWFVGTTMLAA